MRLTRKGFRTWLVKLAKQGKSAGYAASTADCPLARYLKELYGKPVLIFGQRIHVEVSEGKFRDISSPGWADDFVSEFDLRVNLRGSAKVALKILDSIAG